jgi:hypothetical protein
MPSRKAIDDSMRVGGVASFKTCREFSADFLALTVTVSAPQGTTVQGWVNLDGDGSNDLHFAYYAHVVP